MAPWRPCDLSKALMVEGGFQVEKGMGQDGQRSEEWQGSVSSFLEFTGS